MGIIADEKGGGAHGGEDMKLVTFASPGTSPGTSAAGADQGARIGVLFDSSPLGGDQVVLDLQQAHVLAHGRDLPAFASMLDLIRAGDGALDVARALADTAAAGAAVGEAASAGSTHRLADITLLAPVPVPEQIRDCLCFEDHLNQAYHVLRTSKARGEPDPQAALRQYEEQGVFAIPDVWYQQPLYYKGNRFSVVGTDTDVVWPAYSELMDYELEFGLFIGLEQGVDGMV